MLLFPSNLHIWTLRASNFTDLLYNYTAAMFLLLYASAKLFWPWSMPLVQFQLFDCTDLWNSSNMYCLNTNSSVFYGELVKQFLWFYYSRSLQHDLLFLTNHCANTNSPLYSHFWHNPRTRVVGLSWKPRKCVNQVKNIPFCLGCASCTSTRNDCSV